MWSNAYIGLPWLELGRDRDGLDCYGLHRLALAEQRSIVLPSFVGDYASTEERADLARLIAGHCNRFADPVDPLDVCPFDAVLMRDGPEATHIGTVVVPGLMLHIRRGARSEHARYDGLVWRERVVGFWRARAAR